MSLEMLTMGRELENLEPHNFEPTPYKDYEPRRIFEAQSDFDEYLPAKYKVVGLLTALQSDNFTESLISDVSFSDLLIELIGLMDLEASVGDALSEAPAISSILKSREFLSKLEELDFLPSRVVASSEGGIGLVFLTSEKQADIEIFNSGEILAGIYPKDRETEIWAVSVNDLEATVERICGFLFE